MIFIYKLSCRFFNLELLFLDVIIYESNNYIKYGRIKPLLEFIIIKRDNLCYFYAFYHINLNYITIK